MRYLDYASGRKKEKSGLPERLIVALDASLSMDDTDWPPSRLAAAIEAAIALIMRKLKIAPDDQVGVVAYSSDAWWVHKPEVVGSRHKRLCSAVGKIETDGATNITAAVELARSDLIPARRNSFLDRVFPPVASAGALKATPRIVLLTDGAHNTGENPRSIAQALKSDGACIDCIGIGGSPSDVDESLLKAIASKHTDGRTPRYTFIGDKSHLIQKFEQLAGRITR